MKSEDIQKKKVLTSAQLCCRRSKVEVSGNVNMAEYKDYKYPKLVHKPKIPMEARAKIDVSGAM